MAPRQAIGPASRVTLHYLIRLSDGTVAESSREDGEPVQIRIGDGTFPAPVEEVLLGAVAGERRARRLAPAQAWGERDAHNRHAVAAADFPPHLEPVAGQLVEFELPNGERVLGTVLAVDEERVEVDFNHPLAGHTLDFEAEILSVEAG